MSTEDKRELRELRRKCRELESTIEILWIQTWNDNPKPFRWTKTADEILDSLAKYIARISGATH